MTYRERYTQAALKARRENPAEDCERPSLAAAQEAALEAFTLFDEADAEITKLKKRLAKPRRKGA